MTEHGSTVEERIGAACREIESRLDEELPLEELASCAKYSMFHFHRLFRGVTGETVREFARRLRLERAAHRLVHTEDDILRIALDASYDSHEAFTRAFKNRFEITPSAFRAERRDAAAAARTLTNERHPMELRIERRKPVHLACVRHTGPYDQVGQAWATLMKWGWTKMMFGKPETFGLCHDDPDVTPAERVRYDACMVVDERTRTKGDITTQEHPGGVFAVALHEGPYTSIGKTYADLFAHIASNPVDGRTWRLGDPPSIEKYLNDPRKTKPEDLQTEIWMPVLASA